MTIPQTLHAPLSRPLTPTERLIWTGQTLEPEAPLYNMALAIEIEGDLDVHGLERAWRRVAAGADALRTVFREQNGVPTAVVDREGSVPLVVVDLAEGADVPRFLAERTRRSFRLDQPLTDTALVRVGPDRSILYVNQHHLITDATSVGVLYRRLAREYEAEIAGSGPLDDPAPQYSAYAEHLETVERSPSYTRAVNHWDDSRLDRDVAFYGVAASRGGRTERVRISLGEARTQGLGELTTRPELRALTEEHSRFLVFATVLTAWHARASDRSRVAIGIPAHNRTTADARDTLGLFIELFPLRVTLDEDESLVSLAKKVSRGTLEMMRHAVPGASAAPRSRDYRVVLNYITATLGDFAGLPARADWVHSGFGDPEHALRLQVHDFDASGVPTLDFDLDVSVFGAQERDWVVKHFLALFDAMTDAPDRPLRELALVDWDEEESFACRGDPAPEADGIMCAFGARVGEAPDAVAVTDGEVATTYGELAAWAADAEHLLRRAEVAIGDTVGILLPRGGAQLAAMLGTWRAGAAYVPVDPAHPDDRVGAQLADSGAKIVLTDEAFASRVARLGGQPLLLPSAAPAETEPVVWADAPADRLAYVMYTSGSTGQPKGVEVTHGALVDYVAWAHRTYDRGDHLCWAWFTSPAYDLTVTSILTPLFSGGTVIAFPESTGESSLLVRNVFSHDAVDVVKLTPSHLAVIRDLDLSSCPIRTVILGGEDLPTTTTRSLYEALGGRARIFNEYGPTEATVACALHTFDVEHDTAASVPIGTPADGARIHVLGPGGTPTLRGESGELCIAGPRVARGYRGRPALTEASFPPDPLVTGARMYRTGDLGRWRRDGVLEFLGRSDDQVKVGGIRVELGAVQSAVARHPGVHEVVATLRGGDAQIQTARCPSCGIEDSHPEGRLGADGRCSLCARFEAEEAEVARYFRSGDELERLLADARARASGEHDCIMLYSGGKDSTYALCRIVELGANPLVFLLDNGYISNEAKANARRVTELLGVELVIGETPAMPAIFAESLRRFSNVCQGCFKTVYTLALNLAIERGIPAIVTGLSRGQIFETRLADLYRRRIYDPAVVDQTIDEARRAYHRMEDSASRLLDVGTRSVDDVLDQVRFIDFYRFCDVELDELLAYVGERTPWIRPSDTGRSTNCLINEAGIYVHKKERGFHNYALPYSWDVRLGHKQRDAAVAELDDELDLEEIRRMLDEVGYTERTIPGHGRLVAYYTAEQDIPIDELRRVSGEHLPRAVVPSGFVRLDTLPLTQHGKIDRSRLPAPPPDRPAVTTPFVEPTTPVQVELADIWSRVLGVDRIGAHDDFFELGGESIRCIQITAAARERGLVFSPRDLFRHPTVAGLSAVVRGPDEDTEITPAQVSAEELESLASEFGA